MSEYKNMPSKVMFLVRKGDTKIRKVEAVQETPRYVVLRGNFGHRRERKMSLYHRYYNNFGMAKHWVQTELEIELREVDKTYRLMRQKYNALEALTEADL